MTNYLIYFRHYKLMVKADSHAEALQIAKNTFKPKKSMIHALGAWRMDENGVFVSNNDD